MVGLKPTIKFQYYHKQVWFKTPKEKIRFMAEVAKEYVRKYGDLYHDKPTPVGISINVYDRKVKETKQELSETYSFRSTDILVIADMVFDGLENVAYDTKNQVGEVFINKLNGHYQKIEFEVYTLEK